MVSTKKAKEVIRHFTQVNQATSHSIVAKASTVYSDSLIGPTLFTSIAAFGSRCVIYTTSTIPEADNEVGSTTVTDTLVSYHVSLEPLY